MVSFCTQTACKDTKKIGYKQINLIIYLNFRKIYLHNSKKSSTFARFSIYIRRIINPTMAQRYRTQFDSFEGLETVVQAIEGFSQERFLASLHLRNSRNLTHIANIDAQVLNAIASLQTQHAQLVDFSTTFNSQFVTKNNHYFSSAHQLLRKIHSGVTQMKSIYKQFTPNSSVAVRPIMAQDYTAPSIYERSSLSIAPYTRTLFDLNDYPPEVQRLWYDMARFFEVLRDSLLVCLEVIRQEQYIRRDPYQCTELYHDFKEEHYLRIKKNIHSLRLNTSEFSPYNNPAIDLRQASDTEEEFSQKGFHNLEFDDVCTLATKELVEEEQRGIYTVEELQLFAEEREQILVIRHIISNFDEYLPENPRRKTVPADYVACLMSWCKIPLKKNLAFVTYFAETYKKANGQYKPPSNSAVNVKKRSSWKGISEFEQLIAQWECVEIN